MKYLISFLIYLLFLLKVALGADIKEYVLEEAEKAGLNPYLVWAIALVESSGNPCAIGDDGRSLGLFQIQCPTAQDVGYSRDYPCRWLLNYKYNTKYALRYLKIQIKKYGTFLGIAAYNSGTPRLVDGEVVNKKYMLKILKELVKDEK